MVKMSDVELLNDLITDCIHCECSVATIRGKRKELLSRLERGRKAIEAMEKVENWLRNDSLYFSKLQNIINDYQR